jgi:protein tyrosine phosphatase (PTP) superfamily phosphohydrolase (DUF442 family)
MTYCKAMSVANIKNYIQVAENIASSGQPNEKQFKEMAKQSYEVVINLAMPDSDEAIPEEGNIVTSLGMSYIHIPVPFDDPSVVHLRQFIKLMEAVSDQRVWIHCVVNYRVSAFLYQYQRLVLGLAEQEAKKAMLRSWEPNEVWQRFMALSQADIGL